MKAVDATRKGLFSIWWLCLLVFLVSCSSGMFPDITSEEPLENRTFSSAQVRQILIDQPFLMSGDYFLKRNPETESTNLFQIFLGAGEKAKEEKTEQDKRIAKLEEAVFKKDKGSTQKPAPSVGAPDAENYRLKIGFLLDYQNINIKIGETFLKAARDVAESKGAVFVSHQEIKEVLAKTDCMEKRDLACVSKVTGIYPGARFLHLVETLNIPLDSKGGKAKARISIVDTGLGYRYPSMEVEMPVNNEKERDEFLRIVATNLVEVSLEKKNIMPWFCKAFAKDEQNKWFVSAGSSSGIREGEVLVVVSKGKVISAPTGIPAGWIPENPKGTVKVERVVNEDLAIVSLDSGAPPDLEDFLIPRTAMKKF